MFVLSLPFGVRLMLEKIVYKLVAVNIVN